MVEKQNAAEAIPQILHNLQNNQPCRLWITGTSMVPFLRSEKDAVILKPFEGHVQSGDLLLYQRENGQCVLHRVHKKNPCGSYLVCGDNQVHRELVSPSQILASVAQIQRGSKQFPQSHWLWRALGRFWILLFPLRPILLPMMHGVWKILKG